MSLIKPQTIRIGVLRNDFPDWTWTTERYGFGWRYRGTKGSRSVLLQAFAFMGEFDDDFVTRWMVEENDDLDSYAAFWLCESTTTRQLPTA